MSGATVPQQRRVWNVGDTAMFPFRVVDSAGNPVALMPGYPQYAVVSPSGLQVETGVATPTSPPGNFTVNWTIPLQSELSTPNVPWRVEIKIVTAKRHEKDLEYSFDVRQAAVDNTEKRDIIEAVLEGQDYRAFWRGDAEPDSISLQCYYTAKPGVGSDPVPVTLNKGDLQRAVHGNDVVFFYDIPAAAFQNGTQTMFQNQFTLLWVTRDTPTSETMTQYQQLRVIKRNGFELVAGVRMMIDRFQHRLGTAYYISDGDICESLTRGLDLLNGWFPVTDPPYTETMIPPAMRTYWVMLSCWWMLSSQHMLAGTLAFDFCVEESTWVRTDAGVYQIRDLNDFNMYARIMLDAILFDADPEDFLAVCGHNTALDLTRALALTESLFGTAAGDEEATSRQQAFAHALVTAAPLVELDDRREHMFPHKRLDTPLGVQTPSAVWDLGLRNLHRLTTTHGYDVVGTHNHPVLVLDRDLNMIQVHLDKAGPGVAVAVNTTAEPESKFELRLPQLKALVDVSLDTDIELPEVLTPGLVLVIGYCQRNPFSVDDESMHKACFSTVSGKPPRKLLSARLLTALGAHSAGVPWTIMAAPKPLAALYLRDMLDTDGSVIDTEPTWYDDVHRELSVALVFRCPNSIRCRDLQQLLLRFGVVSEIADDDSVLVLDDQVMRYAEAVGFGQRGAGLRVRTTTARAEFPAWVGKAIVSACKTPGLQAPRTHDELVQFLAEHAAEMYKEVAMRALEIARLRFMWVDVTSVCDAGIGRVMDPTLPVQRDGSLPDPLTNLFYTNSIVTHNSGQSISLNQDMTGTLDSAISRLVEWLNTHLTPAKLTLYRRASAVGAIGVRPARIVGPNARTYKMDSSVTGTVGGPPNLQAVAQILGILS